MKVYLATAGEYSDYRVCHVFANREDAEAYAGGDDVDERELREGPVEMRPWHQLWWDATRPDAVGDSRQNGNPFEYADQRDFDGDARRTEHKLWPTADMGSPRLIVQGWDRERVLKVYSEQRAQYLAAQQGIS